MFLHVKWQKYNAQVFNIDGFHLRASCTSKNNMLKSLEKCKITLFIHCTIILVGLEIKTFIDVSIGQFVIN